AVPKPLAFLRERFWVGEAARPIGKPPFVLVRQLGKALHGRTLDPLVDHLVQREGAPLARPCAIGEGDGWRIELPGHRRIRFARRAMTACTTLLEQGRAANQVGRLPRPERYGKGGQQPRPEGASGGR